MMNSNAKTATKIRPKTIPKDEIVKVRETSNNQKSEFARVSRL